MQFFTPITTTPIFLSDLVRLSLKCWVMHHSPESSTTSSWTRSWSNTSTRQKTIWTGANTWATREVRSRRSRELANRYCHYIWQPCNPIFIFGNPASVIAKFWQQYIYIFTFWQPCLWTVITFGNHAILFLIFGHPVSVFSNFWQYTVDIFLHFGNPACVWSNNIWQ